MQYLTLNDGNKMPILGFGVFQVDPKRRKDALRMRSRSVTAALIRQRRILMKKALVQQLRRLLQVG